MAITGIVMSEHIVDTATAMAAALFCLSYGADPMATKDATGIPALIVHILMIVGLFVNRCIHSHTTIGMIISLKGSIGYIPFSLRISLIDDPARAAPIMIIDNGVVILPINPTHVKKISGI